MDAPRVAYLLAAAMADNMRQAGAIAPAKDMSAEWGGYGECAQRDILAAFGAQARVPLKRLHGRLGAEMETDRDSSGQVCGLQVQAYFRLGFTYAMIAAMCRQSADEPQASPHF